MVVNKVTVEAGDARFDIVRGLEVWATKGADRHKITFTRIDIARMSGSWVDQKLWTQRNLSRIEAECAKRLERLGA